MRYIYTDKSGKVVGSVIAADVLTAAESAGKQPWIGLAWRMRREAL